MSKRIFSSDLVDTSSLAQTKADIVNTQSGTGTHPSVAMQFLWNSEDYVDVALNKEASQSSLSPYSSAFGARGVILDSVPEKFGFYTQLEQSQWWTLDLKHYYPIDFIVIHNRRDGFLERARYLQIEISIDGKAWHSLHAGILHFGSFNENGGPFCLPLAGQVVARHVRLRLSDRNQFHLSKVQVFVSKKKCVLARFMASFSL